jgi:hypothetical protein
MKDSADGQPVEPSAVGAITVAGETLLHRGADGCLRSSVGRVRSEMKALWACWQWVRHQTFCSKSKHPIISVTCRRFFAQTPNVMFHRRNLEVNMSKRQGQCRSLAFGLWLCFYQGTTMFDCSGVLHSQFA